MTDSDNKREETSCAATSAAATAAADESSEVPKNPEPIYVTLNADQEVTELESLCMNCYKQGITRLMFLKIPFFKEIIVSAFSCPHCGFESKDVQSGATIQRLGIRYTLTLTKTSDLNRNVVKSDSASVLIPSLEFEIPAHTQRGCLNTVEGIIRNAADNLSADQDYRRQACPEVAEKIQVVIDKLRALVAPLAEDGANAPSPFPFVLVLDDPAGNSFIENPLAPATDPQLDVAKYKRSKEQNEELCLNDTEDMEGAEERTEEQKEEAKRQADAAEERRLKREKGEDDSYLSLVPEHKNPEAIMHGLGDGSENEDHATVTQEQEVMVIPQDCPACSAPGELRSVLTKIPHFKEVVIMAFTCDKCGYRSNEVHPGGSYTDHGTKVTLRVKSPDDMSRSLLKSDTCTMTFPEIDLELGPGTLGSRFTTVEGMIDEILASFLSNPFIVGDSAEDDQKQRLEKLTKSLKSFKTGKVPFTLIMDDPMSNSHIQNPLYPEKDPQLDEEPYKLTWEQMEEFGINNMRTEVDEKSQEYLAPQLPKKN